MGNAAVECDVRVLFDPLEKASAGGRRPHSFRLSCLEEDSAYVDKGRVHTKMKWGWKLYKSMVASFENE